MNKQPFHQHNDHKRSEEFIFILDAGIVVVFTSSNTTTIHYHLTAGVQLFCQETLFQPDRRAPEHVVLYKYYTVLSRMCWGSGKVWQHMEIYGKTWQHMAYGNLVTSADRSDRAFFCNTVGPAPGKRIPAKPARHASIEAIAPTSASLISAWK